MIKIHISQEQQSQPEATDPEAAMEETAGVSRSCCSSIAKSDTRWCLKLAVSMVSWAERGKK